eukprot:CAMPEP_0182879722 /NCGR_PEP_ID=MMETSP0034_2-20130328/16151_1 /TAXON_ID=156128 /ORGANISM="Nephroselmis pyriformis, Strain CCMP717" /LENGTH=399 /DNA_ID=CAMNT_0025012679 /DNA_START=102 /DNA_END=1298 /DNA_ORIENTATION=+
MGSRENPVQQNHVMNKAVMDISFRINLNERDSQAHGGGNIAKRMATQFKEAEELKEDGEAQPSMKALGAAGKFKNKWGKKTKQRKSKRETILSKPPEERDLDDLYFLENMLQHVQFLIDMPHERRIEVCRVINVEEKAKGDVIFEEGAPASSFYIILVGDVDVVTRHPAPPPQQGTVDNIIAKLKTGDSFGEQALLHSDFKRPATLVAASPSRLLKVERADYEAMLSRVKAEELQEKVTFLKAIPIFTPCTEKVLAGLAYVLTERTVNGNTVLAKQGETADEICFIRSGRCRIVHAAPVEKDSLVSQLVTAEACQKARDFQVARSTKQLWGHKPASYTTGCPSPRPKPPVTILDRNRPTYEILTAAAAAEAARPASARGPAGGREMASPGGRIRSPMSA